MPRGGIIRHREQQDVSNSSWISLPASILAILAAVTRQNVQVA